MELEVNFSAKLENGPQPHNNDVLKFRSPTAYMFAPQILKTGESQALITAITKVRKEFRGPLTVHALWKDGS